MKHFGVLTFTVVVAICFTACYAVNFTRGSIGPQDKLIHRELVSVPPMLNKMVFKNITYPPAGNKVNNFRLISAVRALDLNNDKAYGSGFASITEGGPKYPTLSLTLQSFRNLGLNFAVEIWGK